jgi:hypothetical protein
MPKVKKKRNMVLDLQLQPFSFLFERPYLQVFWFNKLHAEALSFDTSGTERSSIIHDSSVIVRHGCYETEEVDLLTQTTLISISAA